MKYQFQFAGANTARRQAPQRKRLRNSLVLVAALALGGLAYWQYIHVLLHGRASTVSRTAAVVPGVPGVVSTKATVAEPVPQLPPALKQATEAGVTTLFTRLFESAKIPTAAAQPQIATANPAVASPEVVAVATPVAAPVSYVAPKPKLQRPLLKHTPEEQLQRAGQLALNQMLVRANKYPDAYGFGPEDIFEQAKLGDPIPVYTIAEADRMNYKAGQAVKPLLKPSNQWVFPVFSGDRICCMVQAQYSGHEYVPGGSSKSLAMAWTKILDKWPAADGYHPQLVVYQGMPGYYFTVPELPTPNVTDTIQMFYYQPSLSPADVILASWR